MWKESITQSGMRQFLALVSLLWDARTLPGAPLGEEVSAVGKEEVA